MSVEIKLTFTSLEEAILAMAKLRPSDAKVEAAPAPKPEAAPTKPKPEKAAASSPSAVPAPTAAPAIPPAASPAPDYKPVGDAIAKKVADGHKPAAVALLAEFGAKSGKDLKPEQYEAFMVKLAAIGEADIS